MKLFSGSLPVALAILMPANPAQAAFHLIRIEQIIGGVNGDTTAQAVQLRVRSGSQPFTSSTRVTAVDATGSNLVILRDIDEDITNASQGNRILLATPNFANYTSVELTPDFIMDPIPVSYLAAGQVRFTHDNNTLRYWLLSWGGSGYTGIQTGTTDNDANGNFSPPVNGALPSTSLQALRFTPTSVTAPSTTNLADYALTTGASVWINNDGATATLVTPPPFVLRGDFNDDDVVDAADYVIWRRMLGTNDDLNGNGDESGASAGVVDQADLDYWKEHFGDTPPGSGSGVEDSPLDELEPNHGGSGASSALNIVPGGTHASGRLNADGNWVWKVQISTSNPIPSGSSPLAAELGFKVTGSALLDANNLSTGAGDDFDTVTPGTPIWLWLNPGTGTNGFPEGLQSNCASGLCTENTPSDNPNTVFAALGSQIYGSPTTADFIEIISEGPSTTGSLTTNISMSGVYGVGSNKGRVAEWNASPPPDSINQDVYTGMFSFTALAGDANLDGSVDATDYSIWLSHVGGAITRWQDGDFNDDDVIDSIDLQFILAAGSVVPGDYNFDGIVDAADYVAWRKAPASFGGQQGYDDWRTNFGQTAGSGGSQTVPAGVPEPSSLVVFLTTCGGIIAARCRRRV